MRNVVYILLLSFLLYVNIYGSDSIKINSISSPQFVLRGENFTVSLKLTLPSDIKSVELYLHVNSIGSLKSVELKSRNLQKQMRFYRTDTESILDKVYKIDSGDLTSIEGRVVQVNLQLTSAREETLQYFITTQKNILEEERSSGQIKNVNIYKQSAAAGRSLELGNGSEMKFDFSLDGKDPKIALIEFWSLLQGNHSEVFNIFDENQNEITKISISDFGYLTTPNFFDAEFFKEIFVDRASWNYFLIKFDTYSGRIQYYLNDNLFYEGIIRSLINKSEFSVLLSNNSRESNRYFDRLKVWSFGNHERLALSNKNFNRYSADSSSVIFENNFDSEILSDEIEITGSSKLVRSTAPIFSKAPILTVSLFGQSYQLSWQVNDLAHAKGLTVEKSYDLEQFEFVSSIRVTDKRKSFYSATDYDYTNNQIIYYRVKQINEDDTFIYSAEAKVGRGKVKHFILEQNFPNPFNPITTISIDVKRAYEFDVLVYDIVGKEVAILHKGPLGTGTHLFHFDGSNLPSGIYLCEIKSGDELEVMKMILAK